MKVAVVLGSLFALASASVIETRAEYPACGPTTGGLYLPDTVTRGQSFPVRFCSDTYFKTSSKSITFALNPLAEKNVNGAIILTDELTSAGGKQYDFEAKVPEALDLSGNVFFAVVEKINDYYVDSSYAVHWTNIKVNAPSA
ncbi:hypothetical protein HDZ31DRAFT_77702 [Schizophyllum fasciatum]